MYFLFNNAQAQDTAVINARIAKIEKSLTGIDTTLKALSKNMAEINSNKEVAAKDVSKSKNTGPVKLSFWQKGYVLLPVILFLIIFMIIILWLRRDGFHLGDALKGDEPIQKDIPNPAAAAAFTTAAATGGSPAVVAAAAAVPPVVKVTQTDATGNAEMPKSSSRFIALFSGFAAIMAGITLISYYMYCGIRQVDAPKFDNLLDAVLALGIGVVPYAFNKLSAGISK